MNEICRIFRVPPHMIADLEKSSFNNIEQQSLDFVTNTIRPWLVRIEPDNISAASDRRRTEKKILRKIQC